MTITGRSWEIAEGRGLKCYYTVYNGDLYGAVKFYDGDKCVATFEVVNKWGFGTTYQETLELMAGAWPPKKGV